MLLRTFQEHDQAGVIQLWHECGLTVAWNDPVKDIERKLSIGRDLFLVGEVDGNIIASVMGGYEGHRGWINYLAVSPQQQRKGYGRQIMLAIEDVLAVKGCPKINLQIRTNNHNVIAFYEAIGFKIDDVISLGKRLI
jgi:ribosomal protein S18 acetylase RimI-like enzyme